MSQKGFTPIIFMLVIVLITTAVAGTFLVLKNNSGKANNISTASASLSSSSSSPKITSGQSPKNSPTNNPLKTTSPSSLNPTSRTSAPTASSVPTAILTSAPKITCTINTPVSSGWAPMYVNFSYTFSNQANVTGAQWDLDGDGNWDSESNNPTYTYQDVKSYETKLRLKLSDGNYSEVCSKTITVNPPQVLCELHTNVASGPAPLAVNFIYGAVFYDRSGDYVTDVQWDFNGDGSWDTPYDVASQHPPVYTFSSPGNYTARLHLKTKNGAETSICTKSISVN